MSAKDGGMIVPLYEKRTMATKIKKKSSELIGKSDF